MTVASNHSAPSHDARRIRRVAVIALFAVAVGFLATTRVRLTGSFYGLYLLERASGRPFEIKDDLKLGDGPRLLGGVSFTRLHERLHAVDRLPRLDLEWDEEQGSGFVTSYLADGREVQTQFGRYLDDGGLAPHGLFVGGAIPEVVATAAQNESGVALHDAAGWHHIWCNVNEALLDHTTSRMTYPGEWTFLGSQVLVETPDRVVIASEHEIPLAEGSLRVERYATFRSGRTFFRLGINLINLGDEPLTISYAYGDEPWVGVFGSADGNVGWVEGGLIPVVSGIDPRIERYAGILDRKSGLADFISWQGASPPDVVYFGNHAGTPREEEAGAPLTSNEVFIGLEWRDRTIAPGETLTLRLSIGLAASHPDGSPTVPPDVIRDR